MIVIFITRSNIVITISIITFFPSSISTINLSPTKPLPSWPIWRLGATSTTTPKSISLEVGATTLKTSALNSKRIMTTIRCCSEDQLILISLLLYFDTFYLYHFTFWLLSYIVSVTIILILSTMRLIKISPIRYELKAMDLDVNDTFLFHADR